MAKGRNRHKENPKKKTQDEYFSDEDIHNDGHDDEIIHSDGMDDSDDEYTQIPVMGLEEDEDEYEDDKEEKEVNIFGQKRHKVGEYSSNEEGVVEEVKEALSMEKEILHFLKEADFVTEVIDEDKSNSDSEPTSEEISVKGKVSSQFHALKETQNRKDIAYEEVKKDHNALTREDQMDVVYSSAPEIVGLLSELKSTYDELEGKVKPLLNKVGITENTTKRGIHYLEVKRPLLLSYSQAITFYLLLKSEGHSVHEHPVLARLVEMKNLLDKMKQLDENLPASIEEIFNLNQIDESRVDVIEHTDAVASEAHKRPSSVSARTQESLLPRGAPKPVKADLSKVYKSKERAKQQTDQVRKQRMAMLKTRADLEEKYKQKGIITAVVAQPDQAHKHLAAARVNGQLQSLDSSDGEVVEKDGYASKRQTSKRSELVRVKAKKPKVISGDDDLPKRDDIGERRRKNELRVLAKAGGGSMHDDNDLDEDGVANEGNPGARKRRRADTEEEDGEAGESENEYYELAKQQRAVKLSAKAQLYSRTSGPPPLAETEEVEDGKRHITPQMWKNRGLTRPQDKNKKNPRTNYKEKHKKAVTRRKGQVRDVKKPMGPYGGEVSGINAKISRSTRFNS
ncbi:hypothetical protein MKW94_006228 [Papaver nudicaule]|uniref:Sas10 C-terminal domain-containing protein n=1 Tax=Papaver nudicaule TaxID=74823 RepID=A0AA41VGN2_PAPNU|nr:hypothetical protein [Papaver nudicaule]